MWQLLVFVLLSVITVLLWLSYEVASAFSLFGSSAIPGVLHFAAAAATACLFVIAVGQLILRGGFAAYMQVEPTGLQRGLVLSALIFAAVAGMLAHLGVDLSTILTTSALVTAIIGLSIQPTLGSLLSGLNIDRAMRVGDGVLINGEAVEVTSLSWRAVVGLKPDGRKIIIPNSKLADNLLEILPHKQPARVDVAIKIDGAVAPHQVSKVVDQILADMDEVDLMRPVVVSATSADLGQYRVTFWVRHYSYRATAEGNFLRRAWYTFQRENLTERDTPVNSKRDEAAVRELGDALETAKLARGNEVSEAKAKSILEAGEMLSYGDGERIIVPGRLAGHACLLISGTLAEPVSLAGITPPSPASKTQQPLSRAPTSRQAWLDRIERLLALRIGPYAEYATTTAAGHGVPLAEVCAVVAREIEDPAERAAFVREVNLPAERTHQPGLLFRSQRDGVGLLWSDPPLRAVDHAVIVAVPPTLLERPVPAGKNPARAN